MRDTGRWRVFGLLLGLALALGACAHGHHAADDPAAADDPVNIVPANYKPDILAAMHGTVAEGVSTTTAAVGLARVRGVEMPITEQMHAILHHGKDPQDAMYELMTRSGKSETIRP